VKGLLSTLLVLVALAVGADRLSLVIAERQVASKLQTFGGLSSTPDVTIHGFPFLTQAVSGDYSDVEVAASGVTAGGARLSKLAVALHGLHVPLSDAVSGSVTSAPVDRVDATVLLSYADLQAQLRDRRLTVAPAGDKLRVTGSVTVLGKTVSASALSTVRLRGTTVVVTATSFEVGNGAADAVLTKALAGRLDFVTRIGRLPYGLQPTGVRVTPAGVRATAAAKGVVLHP
jgi:hypothetical protein